MSEFTSSSAAYVRLGNKRIRVPRRKAVRIVAGVSLTFVGIFPPAPLHLLLPVGLTLLSIDFPRLRRMRRRLEVRIGRRRNPKTVLAQGMAA